MQVLGSHRLTNGVFVGGIDEGQTASLEAGTAEAATVDAVGMTHDFIEANLLGGTALPVVDAAPAGPERQATVGLDVAATPSLGTLLHALKLGVPVFAAAGPGGGQPVFVLQIDVLGHVAGSGLLELAVVHLGIGLQSIDAGTQLVDAHVVLGTREVVFQTREEDHDLIGFHLGMLGDEFVLAVERVEVEEMVFLAEHLAALIELADADADVVELGIVGDVDDFLGRELDIVDAAQGLQEGDDDGCRGPSMTPQRPTRRRWSLPSAQVAPRR